MMAIPANLRRQVIRRAANCCEYCGLAQTGQEATFHVDHIVPVVAGGQSTSAEVVSAGEPLNPEIIDHVQDV
jgi:hypothetical protein